MSIGFVSFIIIITTTTAVLPGLGIAKTSKPGMTIVKVEGKGGGKTRNLGKATSVASTKAVTKMAPMGPLAKAKTLAEQCLKDFTSAEATLGKLSVVPKSDSQYKELEIEIGHMKTSYLCEL